MTMTETALQSLFRKSTPTFGDAPEVKLAIQIAYVLRYQHDWTDLRLHTTSVPPMISGLPPARLYVHPDEQIELLQKQKAAGKIGLPEMQTEREWVLPTHLRDRWSLHRFSDVFDAVDVVPDAIHGKLIPFEYTMTSATDEPAENPWRKTKRLALATVDDDSTVVFYIMHEGIIKPRQN